MNSVSGNPPGGSSAEPGRKLLVVEDEALVALQIAILMENLGWTIMGPVGSLKDADALLENGDRPDAAILDINIGGGTVFPLAEELYRNDVPILFCTGYEDQGETDRFEGCSRVQKPWATGQMVSEVNMMMDNRKAA
ncbi:MAG: hypothetical protein R3E04_08050 [Sphingobium sp.]